MVQVNEGMRSKICDLFEGLGLTPAESKDLEVGIFNSIIEYATANNIVRSWQCETFREAYLAKARSVYSNLKSDSYLQNKHLMGRLKEKEFAPHDLASMKHECMFPELWKEITEQEILRSKAAYEVTQVAMTDQITCFKCKKNKISYIELQIRSSDEPSTHFYRCLVCGNRWKH